MKPIDGTELKKHIESTICYGCEIGHVVTPCGRCHVSDLLRCIDEMPEVDAQPVKRGKWEYRHADDWMFCTACGTDAEGDCGEPLETDFCPNCGAYMRGDADGDQV